MSFTRISKGKSTPLSIPGEVVLSDEEKATAFREEAERSRTMPGAALSVPPPTINESAPHPPRPAEIESGSGTETASKLKGRIMVHKRKGEAHAEE